MNATVERLYRSVFRSGWPRTKAQRLQAMLSSLVLHVHPTWTTRARRADEADGALEHRFVIDEVFDELEAAGFFLGTVRLPGLPARYAIPQPTLADTGPLDTIMARAPFIDLFADHQQQFEVGAGTDPRVIGRG